MIVYTTRWWKARGIVKLEATLLPRESETRHAASIRYLKADRVPGVLQLNRDAFENEEDAIKAMQSAAAKAAGAAKYEANRFETIARTGEWRA